MRRLASIFTLILGFQFQTLSFASEVSQKDIDIRPVIESSTDAYSIFQMLVKARKAYQQQDFLNAANEYSILLLYDPNLEEAVIGAAKSYLALQQPKLAKKTLLKSGVSSLEISVLLAITTARTLNKNEAKAYLLESANTYKDSRLWNLLGHILVANEEFQSATDAFHQAETLEQKPGLLYNNLGVLELQRGDVKEASQHLETAVRLSPNTMKFDNNRRLALLLQGRYLEALKNISSIRSADLLNDAAIVASKREDGKLAKLLSQKANEINPVFNPQFHSNFDK